MSTNPSQRLSFRELQKKLFNSRFFTVSVLLHFIMVLTFGSTVLFNRYVEAPDFTGGGDEGGFVQDVKNLPPPPPTKPTQNTPAMQVNAPSATTNTPTVDAITSINSANVAFSLPQISAPQISPNLGMESAAPKVPTVANTQLTRVQARNIKAFTDGWIKKGGSSGVGSSIRNREVEFVAYLAKYAGGDWNSTNEIRDGKIIAKGSLPNLLYLMNNMSKDKIHASPIAEPLTLSSDEIFSKKPPFIFFTGHRDFVLTDQEVENLRKYVNLGGCIWGDSSLPGRRSRFDLAFRREMRRVIPDADKDWEVLPPTHPMFTNAKNMYYPEIKAPPTGINFYKEPVYALKFAGEVAVLYTANDYGDMWQIALDANAKLDWSRDERGWLIAMNEVMWGQRGVFYRGINEQNVFNAYKFGTNLVIHLITRWEDRLQNIPTGL
ncbi:MAG: DUF4159 domain-containing protein [Verrucomicrobiota bacterium]